DEVLMALADDELTFGKSHARNGEWVDITMRKAEYKKMKAKLSLLEASPSSSQNPKTFQPKNKGLVAKTFDWDEVLMALADDELTFGKSHARNGEWVDINTRKRHIREPIWYLDSGCSRSMTGVKSYLHKYVEQPCPKFNDKQGTIFNANKEIVLIAPRRNDVYVFDMSSLTPNGACFFAKALERYSSVSKAFRVYNIRRQQIEETYHVTFDENSDVSYYIIPHGRSLTEITQENHVLEVIAPNEPEIPHTEDDKGPLDPINTEGTHEQNVQNDQMITQPTDVPSGNNKEVSGSITEPLVPHVTLSHITNQASTSSHPVSKDRWSRDQHIELVNIIGNPSEGMLTRSMAAKLTTASANECLFADFLSKIEPKKVSEALKHPEWIDVMQEELNQFYRNKV
ncbi:hypothetical protein Tco_1114962, partial [Tanacetum coccineum]